MIAKPLSARRSARHPRGRHLAAAAALLASASLSSCSFGTTNFDAQTNQNYNPAEGALNRDGMVDVLNALIVSESDGTGRLVAGLSNNDNSQEDSLTGVTGTDVEVNLDGSAEIPAGGFVQLADSDATMVTVSGESVVAGGHVEVTFEFSEAEPITVDAPVVERADDFADIEIPGSTGGPTDEPTDEHTDDHEHSEEHTEEPTGEPSE